MKQFIDKVLSEQFFDQLPVWINVGGLTLKDLMESITGFFLFFINLIGMSSIPISYYLLYDLRGPRFLGFQKT